MRAAQSFRALAIEQDYSALDTTEELGGRKRKLSELTTIREGKPVLLEPEHAVLASIGE